MLGASTFAEHSIANQGILFFDSATMSGISSKTSVGVGILVGISSLWMVTSHKAQMVFTYRWCKRRYKL